ncbi:MAG: PIN domain-containing protein [Gemmatimonadaceae bacterium]
MTPAPLVTDMARSTPTLLIDINVVLDVVLAREEWLPESAALLDVVAAGNARGFVAGHTITTIHYITARANGRSAAASAVSDLLDICSVVPMETADFQRVLSMDLSDFEDAVPASAALRVGADYIVSRNERDFKGVAIPVRSPAALLPLLRR